MDFNISTYHGHSHTLVLSGWRSEVPKVKKCHEKLKELAMVRPEITAYRLDQLFEQFCVTNYWDSSGEYASFSVDLFGPPNQLQALEKEFLKAIDKIQKER